ncbi:phosphatase PAP2 family protein [Fodinisporobacter ferrooxydans]|uniref:Phosphatase PAP2 family protein n=1 Tax=Fodinisporobacter ferrooxydans TaxID=2901836 RepID=A0ABY4CJN3_9BACL|nr:phosphatase PAP2 family protein [Alicyclobacillaceae bacterium MYW30-H2]
MRHTLHKVFRSLWFLELYEIIGIVVTIIAVIAFFTTGTQLDQMRGIPGYHWQPVIWVYNVYKTFIPKSIVFGMIFLFLFFLVAKRPMRQFPQMIGTIVRVFLPFCLLLAVYRTLQFFIPLYDPHDKDNLLLRIDHWMFGVQPSIWLQTYIRPWLTDYMSFVYASWFPLIFITIVALLIKSRKGVSEFIATSLITFYIGYGTFVIVPAIGPVYTLANRYHVELNGTIISVIQNTIDTNMTIARDCFPSLHTGISIVMLVFIYRYWRPLAWVYGPLVISIIASTIYLRAHYVIDVIAGLLLSGITVVVCPKLVTAWDLYRNRKVQAQVQLTDVPEPHPAVQTAKVDPYNSLNV